MANLTPYQRQLLQIFFEQCQEEDTHRLEVLMTLLCGGNQFDRLSPFRRPNVDQERAAGHDRLMKDYFVPDVVYNADTFRRRFRMRQPLLERILIATTDTNEYFVQKADALGVLGLTPVQKVTAAIRMLAYDKSADALDEYLRIGESTSLLCLREFCGTIVSTFGPEYLRAPTTHDMRRILRHSANRGFPGMLGSLDCMHWQWKNCPRAWVGQFSGRHTSNSLILEAIATYDLWIWHAFFGMPGSCNDINVLDRSPLFTRLLQGVAPKATFTINNRQYDMCYMLTDGIYPRWPVFMQTISNPISEKRKYFAKKQEAARQDVERCFGVLQSRWAILKNPSRLWSRSTLHNVITACIILHNMIVENEHDIMGLCPDINDPTILQVQPGRTKRDARLPQIIANRIGMRNSHAYHLLQNDLVEHLWSCRGQERAP